MTYAKNDKVEYHGRTYRVCKIEDSELVITQARVARYERRAFERVKVSSVGAYVSPAERAKPSNTATCQICQRAIVVRNGKICHHGYTRPMFGYQSASCFGARYAPWEQSRARLGEWVITIVRPRIKALQVHIAELELGKMTIAGKAITRGLNGEKLPKPYRHEDLTPDHPEYSRYLFDHIARANQDLRGWQMENETQSLRIETWKRVTA